MVLTTEALAAEFTGERAFIGVSSFMYHQVVRLGELALARPADELLAMSARPHTQTHTQFMPPPPLRNAGIKQSGCLGVRPSVSPFFHIYIPEYVEVFQ